jgi:hypothetical protein
MPLVGIGTLPTPFLPASVPLPPETGGRGHTSLRVGGWGRVPIPTKGIHYGTLYMYVLCARPPFLHLQHTQGPQPAILFTDRWSKPDLS